MLQPCPYLLKDKRCVPLLYDVVQQALRVVQHEALRCLVQLMGSRLYPLQQPEVIQVLQGLSG